MLGKQQMNNYTLRVVCKTYILCYRMPYFRQSGTQEKTCLGNNVVRRKFPGHKITLNNELMYTLKIFELSSLSTTENTLQFVLLL